MPAKGKASGMQMYDADDMSQDEGIPSTYEKFFNPNYSAEFMAKLPQRIQQRAQVLLHYHEECEKLRKSFEEKETALRRKYDEVYVPMYERRKEIVTGTTEPTEEEVKKGFPSEHEGKVDISNLTKDGAISTEKGLPKFWLRVLQHHVLSASLIEEYDEEVLSHLIDVRSGIVEGGYGSLAVVFVFEPNDYIEEESVMLGLVQKEDGVQITRTPLTWKAGKDVTVKKVTKKTAAKRGKAAKTTTVTVPQPSFFNIFKETQKDGKENNNDEDDDDEEEEDNDEQIEQLLQVLHTSIIPCAVEYYTGEAPDGSSDMESDEEDDDDEEEEEEEEEEEYEPVPRGRKPQGGRGGAAHGKHHH